MQDKLLKKILPEVAGPEAEKLVDLLFNKVNVNEFLIAKKMNMTINQTRNMLYKLADEGLVQFIRKKDKKKGGWYTYFWTLKVKRSLLRYRDKLMKEFSSLQDQLESLEKERHYVCVNCDVEYNEENALLHDYTCPECGEILKVKETSVVTGTIKNEMKKLQDVVSQIDQEVAILEQKELKTKEKRIKEETQQKELERKKKREERQREKKKAMKAAKPKKKENKKEKKKEKKKVKKKSKHIIHKPVRRAIGRN